MRRIHFPKGIPGKRRTVLVMMAFTLIFGMLVGPLTQPGAAQPSGWPTTWTPMATDPDESGCVDHRNVTATYYATDPQYLYLRMETVTAAGWPGTSGSPSEARYKWWFDTAGTAVSVSGTTVYNAEFLLILEDLTDNANDPNSPRDQLGELTLMDDLVAGQFMARWDSTPPPNYTINNPQTAPTGPSS